MHRRAPGFHPGLMTDMYHPDSAYVSWRTGYNGLTTFDLYTRTAPFGGAYLLVAGVEAALEFAQSFRYTEEELRFLARIRDYDAAFLDELANLRFTGEILALPEGTIAFPNEPILRVTAPHALIELYSTEEEAFEAIAAAYNRYTLLLDTYDPRRAIHTAIGVALRSQETLGHTLAAVRLDSGDVVGDSIYAREQLDKAGLAETRILASGDLDEWKITELLKAGAAIDAFGVGTMLGYGAGSPELGIPGGALGAVYKEVWYVDETGTEHPKVKIAGPKSTWPGKKEIYRHPHWEEDIIQLAHEPRPDNYQRLLRTVMRNREVIPGSLPPLSEIRELAQQNLRALPVQYRALTVEQPYPVHFSEGLQALRKQAAHLVGATI